ncbi:MAG: ribose-5-phosphate isomerase RpiA [Methylobacteriaceae bacterium]|nr:ribose-5-phosphate isomerase RpiA [Methylobacteriaceae bacterium]
MNELDALKRQAAARAADFVTDGMKLGLGTGSTAKHFVEIIGKRVRDGLRVVGVPTSEATRILAEKCGIQLSTLDLTPQLDLVVDGADEVDGDLNVIKGGGGALLREKIVAHASARMIIIGDSSKKVARLGRFQLPVEVVPFGLRATVAAVAQAAKDVEGRAAIPVSLRLGKDRKPFVTDGGHYVLDMAFGVITRAEELGTALLSVPGVVEHGLFIGYATGAVIAHADGIEEIGSL